MAFCLPFLSGKILLLLFGTILTFRGYFSYNGNYYNNRYNWYKQGSYKPRIPPGQVRGFWCNYMVKRNASCMITKLDRVIEKYHYLCSGIYADSGYCVGYRTKYVTRYAQEYRIQPVMIKDCCPGFHGKSCDKECFNCTMIKQMQDAIEKLKNDQRLLAQIQLQSPAAAGSSSEPGPPGYPGPPGRAGPSGPSGPPGRAGPSGPVGTRGPEGAAGLTGVKGLPGLLGPMGNRGTFGQKGEPGNPGHPGLPLLPLRPTESGAASRLAQQIGISAGDIIMGAPGKKGDNGMMGERGPKGEAGPAGLSIKGDQGLRGFAGPNGARGSTAAPGVSIKGTQGENGAQGVKGDRGEKGPHGEKGSVATVLGPSGLPGAKGPKGTSGETGINGKKGAKGNNGNRGPAGIPGLPASDIKGLREEMALLIARVKDLEINRCNCPSQGGLGNPDASIFDINKK